jgi:hypothetical protein
MDAGSCGYPHRLDGFKRAARDRTTLHFKDVYEYRAGSGRAEVEENPAAKRSEGV